MNKIAKELLPSIIVFLVLIVISLVFKNYKLCLIYIGVIIGLFDSIVVLNLR